jgi:threonine aldolase
MREWIAGAEVGDDGYGEDPSVLALEALSARMLGKPAALLLPSGTMANLVAILLHSPRGSRALVGDQSDLWCWEGGGAAAFGGVTCQPIATQASGELSLRDLEHALEDRERENVAAASLVCLENTHCRSGGRALRLGYLAELSRFAEARGLAVHMDGARLFNAAAAGTGDIAAISRHATTVSFCLSKGLGAPAGSLLVGSAADIAQARRLRRALGGGMRQAGFLAAAGLYALQHGVERLGEDHANARSLAAGLKRVPGLQLLQDSPETNIVFFRVPGSPGATTAFIAGMAGEGIRLAELGKGWIRAVLHRDVSAADVERVLAAVRRVAPGLPVAVPPHAVVGWRV